MSKYGVGIIGCGLVFPSHAFSLHMMEETEVRAVCDIKPTVLEIAQDRFNCDGYVDYKDLLARKDIDVVHILTPHYLHAEMAIAAAEAGKHVLVEKPMSITIEDANAMLEAAKRNGVTLGVISQNRYNTAAQAIKEAISNGSLGKVLGQRVVITGIKPPEYYKNSDWRGTWEKEGGSLIIDQGVHMLDIARWFIDEDLQSVEATISNRGHPEIETEDTAEGLVTYRNGVKSAFYLSNNFTYNADMIVETHCELGIANMSLFSAEITYKSGKEVKVINDPTPAPPEFEAEFESLFGESMRQLGFRTLMEWGVLFGPIGWKAPRGGGGWGGTHDIQIKNYYESLASGTQPHISGDEAIKSQALISAIYQSAKEGRTIEF